MTRALLLAAALLCAATPALAVRLKEGEEGYRYVQISLGGLWSGFFVFLIGILTALIGVYLWVVWRRSGQRQSLDKGLSAERDGEDDGRVF